MGRYCTLEANITAAEAAKQSAVEDFNVYCTSSRLPSSVDSMHEAGTGVDNQGNDGVESVLRSRNEAFGPKKVQQLFGEE